MGHQDEGLGKGYTFDCEQNDITEAVGRKRIDRVLLKSNSATKQHNNNNQNSNNNKRNSQGQRQRMEHSRY